MGRRRAVISLIYKLDAKVNELRAARVELHGLLRGHFKHAPALAEEFFYTWRKVTRKATPQPPVEPEPVA